MHELARAGGLTVRMPPSGRPLDALAFRLARRRLLTRSGAFVPGAAIHELGGAAMGTDPATSVVDTHGRCWDAPNVVVADGAAFPAGCWRNTTLTIVALAIRAAERAAGLDHDPGLGRLASKPGASRTSPSSSDRRSASCLRVRDARRGAQLVAVSVAAVDLVAVGRGERREVVDQLAGGHAGPASRRRARPRARSAAAGARRGRAPPRPSPGRRCRTGSSARCARAGW